MSETLAQCIVPAARYISFAVFAWMSVAVGGCVQKVALPERASMEQRTDTTVQRYSLAGEPRHLILQLIDLSVSPSGVDRNKVQQFLEYADAPIGTTMTSVSAVSGACLRNRTGLPTAIWESFCTHDQSFIAFSVEGLPSSLKDATDYDRTVETVRLVDMISKLELASGQLLQDWSAEYRKADTYHLSTNQAATGLRLGNALLVLNYAETVNPDKRVVKRFDLIFLNGGE